MSRQFVLYAFSAFSDEVCDGGTIVGNVGLLFVGAVLFLDGVMLRGWVEAAPINFFAAAVQVVTLSYLIFTANGDGGRLRRGVCAWLLRAQPHPLPGRRTRYICETSR